MSEWRSIESAPKDGTVVRVKNYCMEHPVLAKWGPYKPARLPWLPVRDAWVLVEDEGEKFMPMPPGELVIPDEWQPVMRRTAGARTGSSANARALGDESVDG